MLDVKKLERRWLKYKLKKLLPWLLFGTLSVIISGVFLWTSFQSTDNEAKTPKAVSAQEPKQSLTESAPLTEENRTVLEPSMEFVQTFKTAETASVIAETPKQPMATIPKQSQKITPPPPKTLTMPEYPQPMKVPATTVPKTFSREGALSINRNDTKLDIDDLKRRFKETSNANLGLFIARYSYDQGDYNEAYNYALKTNAMNNRIDESWIIFSKSLVQLGKTDQAKKTLQLYISQSNSESARALLDSIEKGTFR